MIKIPTLSFCTTCKNRFYQISETLKKNLDDNRIHQDLIEFILVDFGSTDGLKDWILKNFINDLETGYLKYYYTEEQPEWHGSICKNTAHYCANNDIVVNLDCDNYVGFLGGQYVIRHFIENRNIIFHQFGGDYSDGSYGRISLFRELFALVGGYDESLQPIGYEDVDLINRLKRNGLKCVLSQDDRFCQAIRNARPNEFGTMVQSNSRKSDENINHGKILANSGFYGKRDNIFDYKGQLFNKHIFES